MHCHAPLVKLSRTAHSLPSACLVSCIQKPDGPIGAASPCSAPSRKRKLGADVPDGVNRPSGDNCDRPSGDDYGPWEALVHLCYFIVGIDPGRSNIITAVVKLRLHGKEYVKRWKFTGAQYHTDSGVLLENRSQAGRYADLQRHFEALNNANGSVSHPATLQQVYNYLERYYEFFEEWWQVATTKREDRSRFRRYCGKQRALDRWFSDLKRDLDRLQAEHGFEGYYIAYGSAGPGLRPQGPGQLAVPTTTAFKRCKLCFGSRVRLVDESYTSKISWWSKGPMHHVFKAKSPSDLTRRVGAGMSAAKQLLLHSPVRHLTSAALPGRDQRQQSQVWAQGEATRLREKGIKRRGGAGARPWERLHWWYRQEGPQAAAGREEKRKQRSCWYLQCRGLHWCPCKKAHLDRDVAAAVAIAGLLWIELQGLARPSHFTRAGQQQLV